MTDDKDDANTLENAATAADATAAEGPEGGPAPSTAEEPLDPGIAVLPSSPEAVQALLQKAAKADENHDLFLRARAELDNFRRRAVRERQDAVRFASQGVVEKLIPVLDSFEMALAAANAPGPASLDALRQGLAMVQSQLRSVLADAGVQEVDATGQVFDPKQHEAVSQAESAEVPEGHVLQQLRKGYRLNERLIRPATVIVAKAPGA